MSRLDEFLRLLCGRFDNTRQLEELRRSGSPALPLAEHVNTVCNDKIDGLPADFAGAFVLEESYYTTEGKTHASPHLFLFTEEGEAVKLTSYQLPKAADGGAFDFELTVHSADAGALRLVPRIAVLGVGCRRGIGQQAMEEAFAALLAQSGLCAEAFYKVCSIDLKRDEPGLRAFCAAHGFAFETFSAAQLAAVEGRFSSSGFVQSVTGVDNVCERAALRNAETLLVKKTARSGVTVAAAAEHWEVRFA